MTWLLSLIPGEWLLAGIMFVVVTVGAYFKGRSANQLAAARKEVAAANDRLEMHREATDIEKRVASMSDAAARKEAERWARK